MQKPMFLPKDMAGRIHRAALADLLAEQVRTILATHLAAPMGEPKRSAIAEAMRSM